MNFVLALAFVRLLLIGLLLLSMSVTVSADGECRDGYEKIGLCVAVDASTKVCTCAKDTYTYQVTDESNLVRFAREMKMYEAKTNTFPPAILHGKAEAEVRDAPSRKDDDECKAMKQRGILAASVDDPPAWRECYGCGCDDRFVV